MAPVQHDSLAVTKINVGSKVNFGSPTNITLSFGDGNTGFYEFADNSLRIAFAATDYWRWESTKFQSDSTIGAGLVQTGASSIVPTILPARSDADVGLGYGGTDVLSMIAGGVTAIELSEASSEVIQTHSSNVGLTADSGSAQGNGVILSTFNVYDTVATAGDAATLPAAFDVGTIIFIKNGAAANSMDVFPASGDDLGQGANTVEALAAGDFAVYLATTANATWEKILGGTA